MWPRLSIIISEKIQHSIFHDVDVPAVFRVFGLGNKAIYLKGKDSHTLRTYGIIEDSDESVQRRSFARAFDVRVSLVASLFFSILKNMGFPGT